MSVSSHLAIDLNQYDARIRTFIPCYEEMLDVVTHVLALRPPRDVVDLGTGTGALAARVARAVPDASITAIDEDAGMLRMAARRLRRRHVRFVENSFLAAGFPRCDALVASFALHHVERHAAKRALFARAHEALRRGGILVSADCHPPEDVELARDARRAWLGHLTATYGRRQGQRFLDAWAAEDFYTSVETEQRLLRAAGFASEVVWRRNGFAVLLAKPAR
jgi:ubiquinone/menaquinone biosynthesis C-methylase UbiE